MSVAGACVKVLFRMGEYGVVGCMLQITDYRLQITGYRLQVTGYRLHIAGYILQVTCYKLYVIRCRLCFRGCMLHGYMLLFAG